MFYSFVLSPLIYQAPGRKHKIIKLNVVIRCSALSLNIRGVLPTSSVSDSVCHFPGFPGIFDCFDSENQWDGIVVFVGL